MKTKRRKTAKVVKPTKTNTSGSRTFPPILARLFCLAVFINAGRTWAAPTDADTKSYVEELACCQGDSPRDPGCNDPGGGDAKVRLRYNGIRRGPIMTEYYHDLHTLSKDPVFYGLAVCLIAGPPLLRHEEPEINEAWAGEGSADHIFEFGNEMGNPIFPLSAAAIGYGYSRLFDRPGASAFASDLFRAQMLNGIMTMAVKRITHRTRPDGSAWSFPSGHTSTTFATAAVIYRHFGSKPGIPAFALASYVGLSRLQENRHYLSDVVAGAVLGSYIGLKIAGRKNVSAPALSVAPTVGGVALSWRF
jgi:membrane-associated phospholipid phosphatase